MKDDLARAIASLQTAFDQNLSKPAIDRLADYFEFVQKHNPLLHLVAPCSAEEFAVRHILESLVLNKFLAPRTTLADVGTGAGLPSIPCLIVRKDISGILIESKEKKTKFLEEAVSALGLADRAMVINKQFEEVTNQRFSVVTCRALDKFTDRLPRIIRWAGARQMLLFGGKTIEHALQKQPVKIKERVRMPMSEQRYLFNVQPIKPR